MPNNRFPNQQPRFNFSRDIFTYLQGQVRLADTKAAWTFSVLAVGTAALLSRVASIDWSQSQGTSTIMLLSLAAISIIIAFKHVVFVMYPRFAPGNKSGLIYFEDIVSQKKEEYIKSGLAKSESDLLSLMYEQCYTLAGVVSKKFKALRFAISLTAIALIITVIVLLVI